MEATSTTHRMPREQPSLLVIVGPTAVGKSEIAVCVAERLGGEIVSCDAMQVYAGLPICTAMPPASVRSRVPHHGLEMIALSDEWNVSKFTAFARRTVEDIAARGRVPVLAGGSGLYVRSLLYGLCGAPEADASVRRRLFEEAARSSPEALHWRLREVDAAAAAGIHPNNVRRVIRALEVYELSGRPLSELQSAPPARPEGLSTTHRVTMIGVTAERELVYRWIEARVERMFDEGLVEEVRRARSSGAPLSATAGQVLGVREAMGCLDGLWDVDEAKRLLKRNTRRYAKRQWTWFRREASIQWVERAENDSPDSVARRILAGVGG